MGSGEGGRSDPAGRGSPRAAGRWRASYRRPGGIVLRKKGKSMNELVVLAFVLVIALLVLRTIVHIVPEYQRLVVFALCRYQKTAGPRLILLLPPPIQTSVAGH